MERITIGGDFCEGNSGGKPSVERRPRRRLEACLSSVRCLYSIFIPPQGDDASSCYIRYFFSVSWRKFFKAATVTADNLDDISRWRQCETAASNVIVIFSRQDDGGSEAMVVTFPTLESTSESPLFIQAVKSLKPSFAFAMCHSLLCRRFHIVQLFQLLKTSHDPFIIIIIILFYKRLMCSRTTFPLSILRYIYIGHRLSWSL